MDSQSIKDIHDRLGRIEDKQDHTITLVESTKWLKWHVRALWAALLALLGVKV